MQVFLSMDLPESQLQNYKDPSRENGSTQDKSRLKILINNDTDIQEYKAEKVSAIID
jgi:hypothetical protein